MQGGSTYLEIGDDNYRGENIPLHPTACDFLAVQRRVQRDR